VGMTDEVLESVVHLLDNHDFKIFMRYLVDMHQANVNRLVQRNFEHPHHVYTEQGYTRALSHVVAQVSTARESMLKRKSASEPKGGM